MTWADIKFKSDGWTTKRAEEEERSASKAVHTKAL